MIFPNLELEAIVQLGDRTRLSALKSFVTQNEAAISLVQINTGTGLIDVTSDRYLDWQFMQAGTVTVTARVTASGASADITATIQVLTSASDKLFSSDSALRTYENDVLKWVEDGRNSFLNVHRRVQYLILDQLRRQGFTDINGVPYSKAAVVDVAEVREWATMWALQLIFESNSNATDDIFHAKAVRYSALRLEWEKTALLRLDTDGDGVLDTGEGIDTAFAFVARR